MTVYEQLVQDDWIRYFENEFNDGRVRFDSEGKIKEFCRLSKDILWLPTNMQASPIDRKCNIYLTYFLNTLGFIHSTCLDCWKVVVKPKTVVQLFKLYDLQREMNLPSKCGVEVRSYVPTYYGGYFYTRSREDGLEVYHKVREAVDDISPDIPVILKRACTEYEVKFGRSDRWQPIPNQKEIEAKFSENYTQDLKAPYENPPALVAYIKRQWIHFAANQKIPDMTYLELTGGKPLNLHVEYITYHDQKPLIKVVR